MIFFHHIELQGGRIRYVSPVSLVFNNVEVVYRYFLRKLVRYLHSQMPFPGTGFFQKNLGNFLSGAFGKRMFLVPTEYWHSGLSNRIICSTKDLFMSQREIKRSLVTFYLIRRLCC